MSESQPLKTAVITAEVLVKINEAVGMLHDWGLPTRLVVEALCARLEEQKKQPSEVDRRWKWSPPEVIGEHISLGDDRPTLSCRLMKGRCYSLTPGQRDVVRDRFNMTPAPLVEVIELAMYPDGEHIRRVTLLSCEHVDPRRRAVMTKFSIDEWGQFCADAKARDEARQEAKEAAQSDEDEDGKTHSPKSKPTPKAARVNIAELMTEYGVD